jgi:SAM-dependent methyltransferase
MECRICSNARDNNFYEVQEMMYGYLERFSYYQCSSCGCLQITNVPSDISKYYPPIYYGKVKECKTNIFNYKKFRNRFRNRYAVFNQGILGKLLYKRSPHQKLRAIFSHINITEKTRILDVGCGCGVLLYDLAIAGLNNLLGIDPYIEEDIEYNNGLKILKRFIHEVQGEWDLIILNHSFEHMPNPTETMEIVSGLLSQGGVCLVKIPTVSSYAWEHYRENWVQLDAPRHFFLHSIESIKRLAGKVSLEVEKVVYDSMSFQFWGSEQCIKGIPLRSPHSYAMEPAKSIFSKVDIKRFEEEARKLNGENRGDQAAFYLRK